MNAIIAYSPKVDSHIYGVKGGCQTPSDWIQLAIAALDQAGLSQRGQEDIQAKIEALAESEGLL